MSPVLLFTYEETGPLTEIHLYDLTALQDLAFQYLSNFDSYSPSLTPSSFILYLLAVPLSH